MWLDSVHIVIVLPVSETETSWLYVASHSDYPESLEASLSLAWIVTVVWCSSFRGQRL